MKTEPPGSTKKWLRCSQCQSEWYCRWVEEEEEEERV